MNDEPLVMDVRDIRGTNNPAFGTQQTTRADSPHFNKENAALPEGFHGALDADVELMTEKPVHRAMMFMFARGDTDREVAEATGFTTATVSRVRRQPWMQVQIQAEIRKNGEGDVKQLLASMGPDCLKGIYELAQDPLAKEEVKLRARQDIVDRWIGKACQPTKDETKSNLEEMSDEQLEKIAKGVK